MIYGLENKDKTCCVNFLFPFFSLILCTATFCNRLNEQKLQVRKTKRNFPFACMMMMLLNVVSILTSNVTKNVFVNPLEVLVDYFCR